jgi:uncharacterized membrane-anchored protein
MKLKSTALLLAVLSLTALAPVGRAQDDTNTLPPQIVTLLKSLKYQTGDIDLRGGLARLSLPKEFNFLGPDDANTVLVKLWGNPPSDQKPLGLLIPAGLTPLSSNCWVVTIDYSEDGYVKDDDAAKINYDDLLKKCRRASRRKTPTARRTATRPSRWSAGPRRRIMTPPRTSCIGPRNSRSRAKPMTR